MLPARRVDTEPSMGSRFPTPALYNVPVTIRQATTEDTEALLALERESPSAAHWSRAQYEAIFQAEAPPRLCLVAETDLCRRSWWRRQSLRSGNWRTWW